MFTVKATDVKKGHKLFFLIFFVVLINHHSIFSQTAPGGVATNLTLWLKGDIGLTGGASVSQWDDQSTYGNNAEQLTASRQPNGATSTFNYNTVVSFDGSNDFLDLQPGQIFQKRQNYYTLLQWQITPMQVEAHKTLSVGGLMLPYKDLL